MHNKWVLLSPCHPIGAALCRDGFVDSKKGLMMPSRYHLRSTNGCAKNGKRPSSAHACADSSSWQAGPSGLSFIVNRLCFQRHTRSSRGDNVSLLRCLQRSINRPFTDSLRLQHGGLHAMSRGNRFQAVPSVAARPAQNCS